MIGQCRRATDEAIDRRGADHRAHLVEMGRVLCDRLGRKPARNGRLDQRLDTLFLCHRDPLFPLLARLRRRLAGQVADDDPVNTIGKMFGEAERGRAAHRQAGEVGFLDRQSIHQPDARR